ncbi:hypothetical protein M885DRAFT_321794 [Pelagophyceae sp. CCMP2097]|nr:hypothetical protein M885DRAFT_321794 [Pelagophyceae sp. CCMP2097]
MALPTRNFDPKKSRRPVDSTALRQRPLFARQCRQCGSAEMRELGRRSETALKLSKTCRLALRLGQCGDCGTFKVRSIEGETVQLRVRDTQVFAGYVLHSCESFGSAFFKKRRVRVEFEKALCEVCAAPQRRLCGPSKTSVRPLKDGPSETMLQGLSRRPLGCGSRPLRLRRGQVRCGSSQSLFDGSFLLSTAPLQDAWEWPPNGGKPSRAPSQVGAFSLASPKNVAFGLSLNK